MHSRVIQFPSYGHFKTNKITMKTETAVVQERSEPTVNADKRYFKGAVTLRFAAILTLAGS